MVMSNLKSIIANKAMDGYCVGPHVSVAQCLQVMRELDIGSVVVAQDQRIKGLISERVITRLVSDNLNHLDLEKFTAKDIMDVNIVLTSPQTSIKEAMNIFTYKRTRYLLVVNDDNALLGVVSIGDVTKWLIEEFDISIDNITSHDASLAANLQSKLDTEKRI